MTESKSRQDKKMSNSTPKSIVFGSIGGMIVTVLLLIIFALVLACSNISDSAVTAFSYLATIIGAFAGAFFASAQVRKNGLLTGFSTFAVYLTLMFLIKVIFTGLGGITVWTLIYLGITLVACLIGGVAGVNKKRR